MLSPRKTLRLSDVGSLLALLIPGVGLAVTAYLQLHQIVLSLSPPTVRVSQQEQPSVRLPPNALKSLNGADASGATGPILDTSKTEHVLIPLYGRSYSEISSLLHKVLPRLRSASELVAYCADAACIELVRQDERVPPLKLMCYMEPTTQQFLIKFPGEALVVRNDGTVGAHAPAGREELEPFLASTALVRQ